MHNQFEILKSGDTSLVKHAYLTRLVSRILEDISMKFFPKGFCQLYLLPIMVPRTFLFVKRVPSRAVFLIPGVATHLCVAKILQCVAKKVYCSCPTDNHINLY
jgi:hypothetical protein